MSDISFRNQIKQWSDDELIQYVNSEGGLIFSPPSDGNKEICSEELINRGFDKEKFDKETEKINKRAQAPLEIQIFLTNILLPSNDFFEADMDRYRKYGFRKKAKQDLISKIIGFAFWGLVFIIFAIYLKLR